MPRSNYPNGFKNGITIRGTPVEVPHSGDVYWLDSGSGRSNNKGTFDRPVATLNAAMDLCTANNGDIIFAKAGHSETVSTALTQVMDVAGVSLIGLGGGTDMTTFTFSAITSIFRITADNTYVENVNFRTSIEKVTYGVAADADYVTLMGCKWSWEDAGDTFNTALDVINSDFFTLENCFMEPGQWNPSSTSGMPQTGLRFAKADNMVIRGNHFSGYWISQTEAEVGNASAILGTTQTETITDANGQFRVTPGATRSPGTTGLSSNILIAENYLLNHSTETSMVTGFGADIDIGTVANGLIANNSLGITGDGAIGMGLALDPGSCMSIENYAVDIINLRAVVYPVVAADTSTS
ncbi:hypothetical protein LCGC14_0355280 [marine sediment metagenome]|uniref:Right handed beta helix domain-containing protein n=1 Tax=marine sediment metagenome TaxID=412755 RepID=A0A0F9WHU2_9ZZZZ